MNLLPSPTGLLPHLAVKIAAFQINQGFVGQTGDVAGSRTFFWVSRRFVLAVLETILIFIVFAMMSGQAPPDVNEAHYLSKAKHFWNPSWCAGDIFLESSNAHWLFYVTFGWLTKYFSLSTCAWIGRCTSWLLLAFAWRRVCWRLVPLPLIATLSAMVFLLLNMRFHLAGEWVVGGFEAKGIAYFFVLMAMGDMIMGQWKTVWIWLGAGAAFHVLVGGWAFLASGFSWLLTQISSVEESEKAHVRWWKLVRPQCLPVLAGLALIAVGAIPPLLAGLAASPEEAARANIIYVNHRISHHLNFDAFSTERVARFALLGVCWLALYRGCHSHFAAKRKPLQVLFAFGLGSLLISFVGLLISGLADAEPRMTKLTASLLKYYWFRLADFAIPAAMAIALGVTVANWLVTKRPIARRICAVFFIVMVIAATLLMDIQRHQDPRPITDRRALPNYEDNTLRTQQTYQNWRKVCDWIRLNTSPEAVFITPFEQQSFKWYAERSEVVNWKDVPQDAGGILEWRRRVEELLMPQKRFDSGLMIYSDPQLIELGKRYQADYLLLPQLQVDATSEPTELKQVYPKDVGKKATYVVFALDED